MAVTDPVTLAEAKAQCRVEFDTDDELIASYITAARQWVEGFLNIPLVQEETLPSEDISETSEDNLTDPPVEIKQTWKQAILLIVAYWYANRENATGVSMTEIPLGAKDLLWLDRNVPV